jgi:hypothetical protein
MISGVSDDNPTITIGADEYLAVRFNIGTNVHYGWIRFSMVANYNVTYKDHAYQATPNLGIKAGDKGSTAGIAKVDASSLFEVYPNPAKDVVTISSKNNAAATSVQLINASGAVVLSQPVSGTATSLNVANLPQGVYFAELFNASAKLAVVKVIVK